MATERKLGLSRATMVGLGGAIGFEIFVLLDYAYFDLAGPSMISALFLCGFINLLSMFSYSELSAAIPKVGGEYTYTKAAYGGLTAFMAGCFRWLASVFGGSLATVVFAQQLAYLLRFVPVIQDLILVNTPLIAAILVIVLAALDIRGVREATTLIVVTFLTIFAVFLASGLWRGLTPPEVFPRLSLGGLSGFFASTAYTFTMFVGMRALVAGAPQIKDPGKNVPRALLLSTVLLTAVYCSVAYVAVGVVSPLGDYDDPLLNVAAAEIVGGTGGILVAVAGLIASVSSVATAMMVQSSILGGMSRDGYLPKILQRVHRRFGTRYMAVIASSLFIILFSVIGAVEFLGYAASFGSLVVFALVNLSLMKLRKKEPHLERPFKAPLYPLTPIAGITMSMLLLIFPVFLRDVNAESALMSGLGLVALVLAAYYLRMVGRYRLRVAVGGISVGMGALLALLAPLLIHRFPLYVLIFVSAVSILAGVLNVTARARNLF